MVSSKWNTQRRIYRSPPACTSKPTPQPIPQPTKLYCQSTNLDPICNTASATNRDLATTVGTGTASTPVSSATSFTELLVFDMIKGTSSGSWTASLNISSITGIGGTGRFRIQLLSTTCTIVFTSAYSTTFTTTGVKTLSDSITVPPTAQRVRISVEYKKTAGGLPGGLGVTCDASSFVQTLV